MSKPTILTVDDDPAVSEAVARDLRARYGAEYRIVRATSGAEALRLLDELALRDRPVALILSDHRMPEMTGVELLEQARQSVARTPSWCCSPPTPTPTSRSAPSTTSGSTTTCSSPGTRPRSSCTRCSTTCSTTGGRRTGRTSPASGWSATSGPTAATRSRRSSPATTCPTSGSTSSATTRPSGCRRSPRRDLEDLPARAGAGRRAAAAARSIRELAERAGPAHPRRAAALRPRRRRRPARPASLPRCTRRREGLRTVRRRAGRARRPGRPERAHRELPRASPTACRAPTWPTGRVAPGGAVRRRDAAGPRRRGGSDARARCERSVVDDGTASSRPRAVVIATGVSYRRLAAPGPRTTRRPRRLLRRRRPARRASARATTCTWSAPPTRPARRRCTSHSTPGGSSCSCAVADLERTHVAVPRRPDRGPRQHRGAARHRDRRRRAATTTSSRSRCATARPASPRRCDDTGCSSSSAPRRAPTGSATPSPATSRASCAPGPTCSRSWPATRAGQLARPPYPLETSVPGVFAAGDVRSESMKRVASAVGEGAMAVNLVHRYLATT